MTPMKNEKNDAASLPEIDFLSKKMQYRLRAANLHNELLARAIGMKPKEHPRIVDATAGLGVDSFVLATLGFEITMLERSPVLFELLQQALKRAQHAMPDVVQRLQLIQADAVLWLKDIQVDQQPDVIYLDPMFPERKKSASSRKSMSIMQELLGTSSDHATLFQIAMACAKRRVVVKRPRLAANVCERAANFSLNGKTCRFDVYLTQKDIIP